MQFVTWVSTVPLQTFWYLSKMAKASAWLNEVYAESGMLDEQKKKSGSLIKSNTYFLRYLKNKVLNREQPWLKNEELQCCFTE